MSTERERSLILVGPDGEILRLENSYQNREQWETVETEEAVVMMARPQTLARRSSLMAQITAYIEQHLAEPLSLKGIASHCGVSVSTVTQLFQKKTSMTFHQYVTKCRMTEALQLIQTGLPLEEVGRQVGYADHSTFYRAFRQTYGLSPREYRKKMLSEAET